MIDAVDAVLLEVKRRTDDGKQPRLWEMKMALARLAELKTTAGLAGDPRQQRIQQHAGELYAAVTAKMQEHNAQCRRRGGDCCHCECCETYRPIIQKIDGR